MTVRPGKKLGFQSSAENLERRRRPNGLRQTVPGRCRSRWKGAVANGRTHSAWDDQRWCSRRAQSRKGKRKEKEKRREKGREKKSGRENSFRKVGRTHGLTHAPTHARTLGDFIICPMLCIALDRQKRYSLYFIHAMKKFPFTSTLRMFLHQSGCSTSTVGP